MYNSYPDSKIGQVIYLKLGFILDGRDLHKPPLLHISITNKNFIGGGQVPAKGSIPYFTHDLIALEDHAEAIACEQRRHSQ